MVEIKAMEVKLLGELFVDTKSTFRKSGAKVEQKCSKIIIVFLLHFSNKGIKYSSLYNINV